MLDQSNSIVVAVAVGELGADDVGVAEGTVDVIVGVLVTVGVKVGGGGNVFVGVRVGAGVGPPFQESHLLLQTTSPPPGPAPGTVNDKQTWCCPYGTLLTDPSRSTCQLPENPGVSCVVAFIPVLTVVGELPLFGAVPFGPPQYSECPTILNQSITTFGASL